MNMFRAAAAMLLTLAVVCAAPAAAQMDDPRIQHLTYDPDAVYTLTVSPGHASVIELESGEAVESVVVGDADNWLVETTASADRVVVKPSAGAASTNMVVLTTKRTYTFLLDTYGGIDVFILRFAYPGVAAPAQSHYRFNGDKELYPRLMSDNGKTTAIYWHPETPFPAVFVIDGEGDEIAAVHRPAGDGLIVEGVHDKIVFRSGEARAQANRSEIRAR